ncbi:hypothetical protein [Paraglaciecola sp. T6c]|uniref:hypothetical protein n=1 Tax=Pseudoalteromonas atlantica (strain T6c / ATCC BAA-1087) TaxID=3042615 RepID=UPI0012ED4F77|nr:hypothetical protein [Paraglaciecola sp. T6c]
MSLVNTLIDRMFNLTKFISYGLLILIVIISIVLVTEPSMACSTDYEYQKSRVVEHIESKGWSKEYLTPIESPDGECEAMFLYKNEKQHIQYTVAAGYKVTWWDFNERGE